MKVLIATIFLCLLAIGESAEDREYRVQISNTSQFKKDYLLTEKKLTDLSSKAENVLNLELDISQLIEKAKRHIYDVQIPRISPKMVWPTEEFEERGKYTVVFEQLTFFRMDLVREDEFAYWKLYFEVSDLVSTGSHTTCVVCYLNGEIAEIADQKDDLKSAPEDLELPE